MTLPFAALLLGLLPSLATPAPAGGEAHWYADFDAAAAVAKEQGKDLLVDFTGSDWCGWCIRLHKEVFDFEEFAAGVEQQYVLVALDFPNGAEAKAKVPDPERNDELQRKYGIQGFPTILLMTAEGEVYAQTGYREGGPKAYVEHLAEIRASGKAALTSSKKLLASFAAAEGEAKVVAWKEVCGLLETLDSDSPFAAPLAEACRWALEADADNAQGLKLRAVEALMKAGVVDESVQAAVRELDGKNERGLLERAVEAQFASVHDDVTARAALTGLDGMAELAFVDSERAFQLYFTAASWCGGPLEDPEGARKYAARAKAVGTEDEELMAVVESMLGQ